MKNLRFLLVVVSLLFGTASVNAKEDFEVDGIYYNIIDYANSYVEVTYKGDFDSSFDEYAGDVVIPETVTYANKTFTVTRIGYLAFCACKNLNSVTIPNSVTSIVRQAFYCSSITSVKLGGGVKEIGNQAFSDCTNLTSVTIPDNVTSLGDAAFSYCSNLSSLVIGDGITRIGSYVFCRCKSLVSVIIPDCVTTIGLGAFDNCSNMTSLIIGSGVKIIEARAFLFCDSLKNIKVFAEVPPVADSDTFNKFDAELCVPKQSLTSYQTTAPWSKFKSIRALTDEETGISNVKDYPFEVQARGGIINVTGVADGTMVEIYGLNGTKFGEGKSTLNSATINIGQQPDNIVIVRIGKKAMKVVL